MKILNKKWIITVINLLLLCVVVIGASLFFVFDDRLIGYVLLGLFLLCLGFIKMFGISIRSTRPDIVFGFIDNSILVLLAVFGGHFGGVAGAIIGGAVGNAVTDGIAGLFEGAEAERNFTAGKLENRTILGTAVGKMAGCLLGAGVILVIAHWLGW
ncbi:MAG: hypothetical protein WC570_03470 [Patescibacteria group bacterium]